MTEKDYEDERKEKELGDYLKNKPEGGYSKDNTEDPGPGEGRTDPPDSDKNNNNTTTTDSDKVTAKKVVNLGADLAGQMAAAHRQSWSGYSGGTTDVRDSSKNFQKTKAEIAYSGKQSTPVRELDDDAKRIMRQLDNLDRKGYG